MSIALNLLFVSLAVLLLGVVVFVHELGHFLAAKLSKIAVSRFSIGFGRAIWQREFRGTLYQIGWIPCGGFVEIVGHSDKGEVADALFARLDGKLSAPAIERLRDRAYWFRNRPGWAQFLVAASGPAFSFLFTILIYTGVIWTLGTVVPTASPVISLVTPNTPAFIAGVKEGDHVLAIDGNPTVMVHDVIERVALSGGRQISLRVQRGAEKLSITVTPAAVQNEVPGRSAPYRIGVAFAPQPMAAKDATLTEAAVLATSDVLHMIQRTGKVVVMLITGQMPLSALNGPVGIVHAGSNALRDGLLAAILFAAFISTAVGATQLIPVPPLDGSHMLFAGWKMLTGRSVWPQLEGVLGTAGLCFAVGLMLYITAREIFWLTI